MYHRANEPELGVQEERSELEEKPDTSSGDHTEDGQDDQQVEDRFLIFDLIRLEIPLKKCLFTFLSVFLLT